MTLTTTDADKILADDFAPWVLELGLSVEALGDRRAVLRLPWSERLAHEGGSLSGQALMAAADTATVIAVPAARGRRMAFTDITMTAEGTEEIAARASTVYALPG